MSDAPPTEVTPENLALARAFADGALAERERIIKAIEEEADQTLCSEDAMVTREIALLVRANFSHYRLDELKEASPGWATGWLAKAQPQQEGADDPQSRAWKMRVLGLSDDEGGEDDLQALMDRDRE